MIDVQRPFIFFFFNDTATTEIYTLSLHDALPICLMQQVGVGPVTALAFVLTVGPVSRFPNSKKLVSYLGLNPSEERDRKSTRLNSSHSQISYAVFCLKKKKQQQERDSTQHLCAHS